MTQTHTRLVATSTASETDSTALVCSTSLPQQSKILGTPRLLKHDNQWC